MPKPVYLDYNATTPLHPEVIEAMMPFLAEYFGNPSSANYYGMITKKAVENARLQVAQFLNCGPDEIVFTSGGTEANNMAIMGFALANKTRGHHIITSAIEHPAVTEVCRDLAVHGFDITILPVNKIGIVDVADVERALRPETILISVMHANNETGALQPIAEISALAKSRGIALHTDSAQSAGKIPVDVGILGVDMLSLAGHKLYAPKGIGVLYVKKGVRLNKIIQGAGQESGRRPGTENMLGIVGLGKACEIAGRDFQENHHHLKTLRNHLYYGLKEKLQDDMILNGDLDHILPNTLNVSFRGIIAGDLVSALNENLVISAGAACHSGITRISDVLLVMKVPEDWARGAVRISVGRFTTIPEIDKAIELMVSFLGQKNLIVIFKRFIMQIFISLQK